MNKFVQPRPYADPEAAARKELEAIRQQIEQFDTIEAIDPEMRGIVVRNWPHLVAKGAATRYRRVSRGFVSRFPLKLLPARWGAMAAVPE